MEVIRGNASGIWRRWEFCVVRCFLGQLLTCIHSFDGTMGSGFLEADILHISPSITKEFCK